MSFPLLALLHQDINGFYKLQSQACLSKPQPVIPLLTTTQHFQGQTFGLQQQEHKATVIPHYCSNFTANMTSNSTNLSATRPNDDEMTSIDGSIQAIGGADNSGADSLSQPTSTAHTIQTATSQLNQANNQQVGMVLSKKALHQRDADENLFLRFLELDPPSTTESTTATSNNTTNIGGGGGGNERRLSNPKPIGRTPFTMTKKLTRTAERGFGFSIVWTHPPRVEKIEPGLSADRCGILPGDYVIFVDKHNVVTMPEADVLNLIRSQGSNLTLEIFRRCGGGGSTATGLGGSGSASIGLTALSSAGNITGSGTVGGTGSLGGTLRSCATTATTVPMNGRITRVPSGTSTVTASEEQITVQKRSSGGLASSAAPSVIAAPVGGGANVTRPATACSMGTTSSIEAAKRRLHLPQVTFSKEVGEGVIV